RSRTPVTPRSDVGPGNRRGPQPLHYAADSSPGSDSWSPAAQATVIAALIAAGADPNATDKSGVAPLHRAVRTRSSAAVRALLEGGADPKRTNKSGSTPMKLAMQPTGRGGSGSTDAKAEQALIVELRREYGAAPSLLACSRAPTHEATTTVSRPTDRS